MKTELCPPVAEQRDQRISEWLDDIRESSTSQIALHLDSPSLKRKLQPLESDDTPRAKRSRPDDLQSPSLTGSRSALDLEHTPSLTTQSSRSSQATSSRSPSPSKRGRALAIKFSGPILQTLDVDEAAKWTAARTTEVPLLEDLFSCVANTDDGWQNSLRDEDWRGIHKEVGRCLKRKANEDSWSDWVVLPSLQLARKLSKWQSYVDIINVKSIDIVPTTLLSGRYKKRVDYSLGLDITDTDMFPEIQQSLEPHTVSQSDHWLLNDRVLFSHIEIKAESDRATAESQLKVWCTAGFRKQERMYRQARRNESITPTLAPQPLWIWEQDKVHLSIAVMDSTENRIYFLDRKTFFVDGAEPKSLLPVFGTMIAIIDWGYNCYLPWFRELIGQVNLNDKNS
ncbi:uncharacterized protein PV07_12565 [Cladophialophora immunda]|uniref:PD-(D/E)XK nuclease-like domain-containing protein n=1 Tax=Cladophialophora immunda TaxID=569365 RepID=A0A0D2BSP3_9EURO|nr:uncharacterized protein PV07_12565 [Cladophialophora immunda]KIW22038.1 hypothetical protein PV07_12565 [Cladophialophora immunda]